MDRKKGVRGENDGTYLKNQGLGVGTKMERRYNGKEGYFVYKNFVLLTLLQRLCLCKYIYR